MALPVLLALLVSPAGCRHRPPAEEPPFLSSDVPVAEGASSYRFMFDRSLSADDEGFRKEQIRAPHFTSEPTLPEYPAEALAAGFGDAVVGVRIWIGTEGIITRIEDTPRISSTPGPFAADFHTAVEAAVRRWRFVPAARRIMEPGSDLDGDGTPDYEVMVDCEAITTYVDVRFDFCIVEGEGRVTTGDLPEEAP